MGCYIDPHVFPTRDTWQGEEGEQPTLGAMVGYVEIIKLFQLKCSRNTTYIANIDDLRQKQRMDGPP